MALFAKAAAPDWPQYLAQRAATARDARLARFFAAGTIAPDTPINEAPLVALDMETTGLDPQRHAIVSIGLVPFTLNRIALAQRRYWVVRPLRPLSDESVAFHHITHADIAQAPIIDAILAELLEALAGRLVVVHFRHIERPFLNTTLQALLGEGIQFPVIDTMSIEARRYRQSIWARFRRWIRRPPVSIRLHNSRMRYGLPAYQGHHALTDALATAELLQAQIARHFPADVPIGSLWR
ncbi:DNA polymerase-3 subunit epsilon [Methylohalomonas lacus]|uniref:DNA polymerase-3 subunit epsilon n=1 Tax=Methylohalomonas lacus TaxID=398773 RepID=A0AAE3HML5_9GAMM|nr:3'-5' exonuclease [Methylohalomonas lacus]MCS3903817.1 DNA polymerase-3 subunit epsilon [Methylohalomonas lacus]